MLPRDRPDNDEAARSGLIPGRDSQPVSPCLCRAALARKRIRPQRSRSSSEASEPQQQCLASQRRSSGASQRATRPISCSLCGSVGSTAAMATQAIRAPIVPARPGSHGEHRAAAVPGRANGPARSNRSGPFTCGGCGIWTHGDFAATTVLKIVTLPAPTRLNVVDHCCSSSSAPATPVILAGLLQRADGSPLGGRLLRRPAILNGGTRRTRHHPTVPPS